MSQSNHFFVVILLFLCVTIIMNIMDMNQHKKESYNSLPQFRSVGVPYSELRPGRITPEFGVGLFPPFVNLCQFDDMS